MGDVAGGGGAAAAAEAQKRGRPMDADTLARLRKEASETHGAPHELPDECLKSWIKFSTSKIELALQPRVSFSRPWETLKSPTTTSTIALFLLRAVTSSSAAFTAVGLCTAFSP